MRQAHKLAFSNKSFLIKTKRWLSIKNLNDAGAQGQTIWVLASFPSGMWVPHPVAAFPQTPQLQTCAALTFVICISSCCSNVWVWPWEAAMLLLCPDPWFQTPGSTLTDGYVTFKKCLVFWVGHKCTLHKIQNIQKSVQWKVKPPLKLDPDSLVLIPEVSFSNQFFVHTSRDILCLCVCVHTYIYIHTYMCKYMHSHTHIYFSCSQKRKWSVCTLSFLLKNISWRLFHISTYWAQLFFLRST